MRVFLHSPSRATNLSLIENKLVSIYSWLDAPPMVILYRVVESNPVFVLTLARVVYSYYKLKKLIEAVKYKGRSRFIVGGK